jgi:hypothetical protein
MPSLVKKAQPAEPALQKGNFKLQDYNMSVFAVTRSLPSTARPVSRQGGDATSAAASRRSS